MQSSALFFTELYSGDKPLTVYDLGGSWNKGTN